jgi:hypothetical protein
LTRNLYVHFSLVSLLTLSVLPAILDDPALPKTTKIRPYNDKTLKTTHNEAVKQYQLTASPSAALKADL